MLLATHCLFLPLASAVLLLLLVALPPRFCLASVDLPTQDEWKASERKCTTSCRATTATTESCFPATLCSEEQRSSRWLLILITCYCYRYGGCWKPAACRSELPSATAGNCSFYQHRFFTHSLPLCSSSPAERDGTRVAEHSTTTTSTATAAVAVVVYV